MHLRTRQVPEIDGSQGGGHSFLVGFAFIGLVVALSVLIVVCCAAVFYLLRHHEPTDQDRTARRERYRRTREHTLNSGSSFAGPSTSTVGLGSLGDKVKLFWQSTTGTGSSGEGRGRRGGRGWIRAGSDDEWASHSDHEGRADPELGGHLRSLPVLRQDTRGGVEGNGVRVVESPSSDTEGGFIHSPYAYTYTDPFPKTASQGALQRSQSPLSSPVSSPRECASVDESREAHTPGGDHGDHHHRPTMSNGSVWTHAGSKFVEDI
ncbi:hypothetical protein J3R82DRAFT_4966 [Butyriboletus roseoflavus]|nr:hypothetical protein J3R82DRAFT_6252 [Butyriboletus roseoflavus]KAG8219146.1 hypothetical protein J3R82DRAFT_4966 [Butyriboletus roseoflavus]